MGCAIRCLVAGATNAKDYAFHAVALAYIVAERDRREPNSTNLLQELEAAKHASTVLGNIILDWIPPSEDSQAFAGIQESSENFCYSRLDALGDALWDYTEPATAREDLKMRGHSVVQLLSRQS